MNKPKPSMARYNLINFQGLNIFSTLTSVVGVVPNFSLFSQCNCTNLARRVSGVCPNALCLFFLIKSHAIDPIHVSSLCFISLCTCKLYLPIFFRVFF